MLVSIISVSFNSAKTIAKTIESVMNQTYQHIEYVVIDGASSDGTQEIVSSYIPRFESVPGRTMRIVSEPDKGMYDALNKGALLATGELVGQINCDDFYEPDAVEKMVALYEAEHYDIAWGDIRILYADGKELKKRAKIGKLWTTTGWCHPSSFSKRSVLLEHPYPLETMYDDFDYVTAAYKSKKKLCTLNETISNFTYGGMSTQKGFREAMKRVNITYGIYRKYRMSRLYWFHRFAFEMAKMYLCRKET